LLKTAHIASRPRGRVPRCGCPHWLLNLPLFRFQGAICRGAQCRGHGDPGPLVPVLSSRSRRRIGDPVAVRGEGRLYRRPLTTSTWRAQGSRTTRWYVRLPRRSRTQRPWSRSDSVTTSSAPAPFPLR